MLALVVSSGKGTRLCGNQSASDQIFLSDSLEEWKYYCGDFLRFFHKNPQKYTAAVGGEASG